MWFLDVSTMVAWIVCAIIGFLFSLYMVAAWRGTTEFKVVMTVLILTFLFIRNRLQAAFWTMGMLGAVLCGLMIVGILFGSRREHD